MEAFSFISALVSVFIFLIDYESGLDSTRPASPGLIIVPNPEHRSASSNLIWFKPGEGGTWTPWVEKLNTFIHTYMEPPRDTMLVYCGFDTPVSKDEVCYPDLRKLGSSCTAETNYGYQQGQPCVMLHVEKVIDWVPVPYNSSGLPSDMPKNLQNSVKKSRYGGGLIWVSCDGESPADRENIGPIVYWSDPGFPVYYFPYTGVRGYLSPIIAVQFVKPTKNVVINIECRAWAQNIVYDRLEKSGSVHFELLID